MNDRRKARFDPEGAPKLIFRQLDQIGEDMLQIVLALGARFSYCVTGDLHLELGAVRNDRTRIAVARGRHGANTEIIGIFHDHAVNGALHRPRNMEIVFLRVGFVIFALFIIVGGNCLDQLPGKLAVLQIKFGQGDLSRNFAREALQRLPIGRNTVDQTIIAKPFSEIFIQIAEIVPIHPPKSGEYPRPLRGRDLVGQIDDLVNIQKQIIDIRLQIISPPHLVAPIEIVRHLRDRHLLVLRCIGEKVCVFAGLVCQGKISDGVLTKFRVKFKRRRPGKDPHGGNQSASLIFPKHARGLFLGNRSRRNFLTVIFRRRVELDLRCRRIRKFAASYRFFRTLGDQILNVPEGVNIFVFRHFSYPFLCVFYLLYHEFRLFSITLKKIVHSPSENPCVQYFLTNTRKI